MLKSNKRDAIVEQMGGKIKNLCARVSATESGMQTLTLGQEEMKSGQGEMKEMLQLLIQRPQPVGATQPVSVSKAGSGTQVVNVSSHVAPAREDPKPLRRSDRNADANQVTQPSERDHVQEPRAPNGCTRWEDRL